MESPEGTEIKEASSTELSAQEKTTDKQEIASLLQQPEPQPKPETIPKSETEFKSFGPTLAKIQTLLTTAFPVKQDAATEEVFPSEQETKQPEKPLSSAEIRQKLEQVPTTMQVLDDTFATSIKGITEEIFPVIQQISPSSTEDIERLNELLDTATSKIQGAKVSREQEVELRAEYERLKTEHAKVLLEEANTAIGGHFKSFDQLSENWTEKSSLQYNLGRQRFWTGKFFNRDKIKQLDRVGQIIGSFFDRKYEVENGNAYPSTTAGYNPVFYNPERTIAETATDIVQPVIKKMLQRYDELASRPKEQESVIAVPEIPASLRDSLDTDFINKYFLPHLKKSQEDRASQHPEGAAEFSDPKNIREVTDIVRQSLRLHHDRSFSPMWHTLPAEEEAKNKELHDRLEKLPYGVKDAVEYFFGYEIFNWCPMEENYQAIVRLVQATQDGAGEVAQVDSQKEFLGQIESLVSRDDLPYSIKEMSWTASRKRYSLPNPQGEMEPLVDDFLQSIDNRIWFAFLNNPEARQTFGAEQLDKTNLYLVRSMLEKIVTQESNSEEAKKIGYRLLDFKSPATIPIVILNAYRDPESFMYHGSDPEQTVFCRFISELTEQELEQLKQENIPGLLPLIDLVKSSPQSQWLYSTIWDEQTGASRPDPISKEINKKLVEMSLYLLDKGDKSMEGFITGVFDHYNLDTVLEAFSQLQQERGELPLHFANTLMRRLRKSDPLLREQYPDPTTSSYDYWMRSSEKRDPIPEESYKLFHQSIDHLLREINNPESNVYQYRECFSNEYILRFIARQPERVEEALNLPLSSPYLFSVLLKEGGPLYTNIDKIMENIFSNGNALKRAKEIETIFSKKVPYWKQLYLFTDARIGEQLATATSEYPITEVIGIPIKNLVERHRAEKQQNPEGFTRLQAMIENPEVIRKLESGEIESVPFTEFNGVYKRLVFRDLLKRSIETSRNQEQKARADSRNRLLADEGFGIPDGTYIHGSAIDVIESVLLNGNLPQEALGEGAGTDSYPFQTDFSCITQEFISSQPNVEEVFNKSLSGSYGSSRTLGHDGQLFYIYRRTPDAYEGGKKYGPSDRHALVLGGMPATEISGIALRNASVTLETAKKAILENGFYIPVYDLSGNLVFTPKDYDSSRADLNYAIPVEIWDYSLKTGEQLGSNPGGEFTVPTEQGPIKYYVKFANPDSTDQIWNEQLADNIYRYLGVIVPDTKIVKIDTIYGHSSQLLPHDEEIRTDDLRNGFIADVLLANWDIVANSGNIISSEGRLVRIDNGGSILFKARGEKKSGFSGIVTELESMKGSYPGLTQEDIQNQLVNLRERFVDDAIGQLVDSVRLNNEDRDYLKTTLRQRRDYILSYYSPEFTRVEARNIPEQVKA